MILYNLVHLSFTLAQQTPAVPVVPMELLQAPEHGHQVVLDREQMDDLMELQMIQSLGEPSHLMMADRSPPHEQPQVSIDVSLPDQGNNVSLAAVGETPAVARKPDDSTTGYDSSPRNLQGAGEAALGVPDLVKQADAALTCVKREVETDGYTIAIFRLTHGDSTAARKPVFLQHGLFGDATAWVKAGAESLAVVLARAGYEVWLGNSRGNQYSSASADYDYSFEENGKEMAAQIEEARGDRPKVTYIGHSGGTTQMFAQLADGADLDDKIDLFIACAPIVSLKGSELAGLYEGFEVNVPGYNLWQLIVLMGMSKIDSQTVSDFGQIEATKPFQQTFFNLMFGNDGYVKQTVLDKQNDIGKEVASMKSVIHYMQMIETKIFAKFDYGAEPNLEKYGTSTPPEYNLTKISNKIPIALLRGVHDTMVTGDNMANLNNKLGEKVLLYKEYRESGHFAFTGGKDMTWTKDVEDLLAQVGGTDATKAAALQKHFAAFAVFMSTAALIKCYMSPAR